MVWPGGGYRLGRVAYRDRRECRGPSLLSRAMRATRLIPVLLGAATIVAGCGHGDTTTVGQPVLGVHGGDQKATQGLGYPGFATKNTTRIGGADAVADAGAVALAVFPSTTSSSRPSAVTLVDQSDWRVALAASVLMATPVRAPLLFSDGGDLPGASADALAALKPHGATAIGGAQLVRVGDVARPAGLRSVSVSGADVFALTSNIDRLAAAANGATSPSVIVVGADDAPDAMPAAGYAAKSGNPILFVNRDDVPKPTQDALRRHQRPHIYVLGPPSSVGPKAVGQLRRFGAVTRISGSDPVSNAIAFARFDGGTFGWNVQDPGHGLVFANASQPLAAAAAAPLSASGTYGPLLLVQSAGDLGKPLTGYLLDIQPGYRSDPVRGVYNHAWLIGDESAISTDEQAQIDSLLEIAPVDRSASG